MTTRLQRVSPRVHCVRRSAYASCSYVVERDDGVVLVDAGMRLDGSDTVEPLRQLGHGVADVRAILLTHGHNDHTGGAACIRELSGAKVYCHGETARQLSPHAERRGAGRWIADRLPEFGLLGPIRGLLDASLVAVEADALVCDGDLVERDFRVIETPGHEVGHVSYFFEPERVLFAGDALAVAGDHVTYMSRYLTRDVERARASMQRVLELDCAAICPGHRYPLVGPTRAAMAAKHAEVATISWPIIGR